MVIKTIVHADESVRDEAAARIQAATYGAVRGADCEFADGVLFLRGRVPSFYCKQLAQEAVGRLPGVLDVVNQIDVV